MESARPDRRRVGPYRPILSALPRTLLVTRPMHEQDFELLYRLEENYWWFPAMREITDTIVGRELRRANLRILDAGCGTGFNLGYYAAADSRDVYGLDLADSALKHVRKRGYQKIAQASITHIPFKSDTFDVVFSFEVVTQTP